MTNFTYNDAEFSVQPSGNAWCITRLSPGGGAALVGTGLFPGLPMAQALQRAQALVRLAHPVGVKVVGPDVAHATTIGGLKIVGPDVNHPQFAHWERDSSSFPQTPQNTNDPVRKQR